MKFRLCALISQLKSINLQFCDLTMYGNAKHVQTNSCVRIKTQNMEVCLHFKSAGKNERTNQGPRYIRQAKLAMQNAKFQPKYRAFGHGAHLFGMRKESQIRI